MVIMQSLQLLSWLYVLGDDKCHNKIMRNFYKFGIVEIAFLL